MKSKKKRMEIIKDKNQNIYIFIFEMFKSHSKTSKNILKGLKDKKNQKRNKKKKVVRKK